MAADGGSILIKVLGDTGGFGKAMSGVASTTSKAMSGIASVTSASVKVATGAILGMGTAVVGLGKIGFDYNKELESYTTNFGVMLGDAEEATAKVAEIKAMAASTPFALADLAGATEQLLAFGVQTEDTQTYLQQLGDISLGSKDKLGTLVSAFGKMNSTGKVTLETINMMSEQGFNPLQEISRTTGESMESLYDRVSDGAVSLEEITTAFDTATSAGGQFEGGMEAASKTTDGLISTLKDNATSLIGEVYKPITDGILQEVLPSAISGIDELTNAFREDGINGLIDVGGELLGGLITGVANALPEITELSVSIITSLAEQLVENAPEIALAAGELLTALATGIFTLMPLLTDIALQLLVNFGQYLVENAPSLLSGALGMMQMLNQLILDNFPLLAALALGLLISFAQFLVENADSLVNGAICIIATLAEFLIQNLPTLILVALDILLAVANALAENASLLADTAVQLMFALISGLLAALPDILQAAGEIIYALIATIDAFYDQFIESGDALFASLWQGMQGVFDDILGWADTKIHELLDVFGGIYDGFVDVGSNIINGIWEGLSSGWSWLTNKVSSLATGLLDAAKGALGIHSPSRAFRDEFSGNIIDGGVVGIDDNKGKLIKSVDQMGNDILSNIDNLGIADAAMNIFGGVDGTISKLNWGVGMPTASGASNSSVTYTTKNEYNTTIEGVDNDPDVIAKKLQDEWEYGV